MEINNNVRILIIDDEPDICKLLDLVIAKSGMKSESFIEQTAAMNRVKEAHFDVVLLDVRIHNICGLSLIPGIRECHNDIKIIVMTGYADKETAIKALKSGAFDFLEKPLDKEILLHSIDRALQAQAKERSISQLIEDLKSSESNLKKHKNQLEYLNSELLETNKALSLLARNIEREREQMEKRIAIKLKSLIIPTLQRLARDKSLSRYGMELDMLTKQIEDLTTGFGTDAFIASCLSFTELKIASLIKNGLTSEEIAEQLHIAPSTVRTHRKNIRKKLKINNAKYSLRNYLDSKGNCTI